MFRRLSLFTLVALVAPLAAQTTSGGHDATLTPNTSGSAVVEMTAERIQVTCTFDDDKLFLRRVAYVETKDGKDSGTFRNGYHGGIWKVDEPMFKRTQEAAIMTSLQQYIDAIKANYGIEWNKVTWVECRKPLISALAAKLFIQSQTSASIPRDIPGQASFWKRYYRARGDAQRFINDCNTLNQACPAGSVDIVFVLDGSGSVGSSNFETTKRFVREVVSSFNIGSDKTRVALVKYSSTVSTEFFLRNNFMNSKSSMLQAIDNMSYPGGGTHTYDAIDYIVNVIFTNRKGARDSDTVPRVAVILTDGNSNLAMVETAASRAHNAKITMFAVGIGSNINHGELTAIASVPKCLHLFELSGFSEVGSLKYAIEKGSCDAPIIVEPGKVGSEINTTLPAGGDQNCKMKIPSNGATVKINPRTGSASFFVARNSYPSEFYYESKVDGEPGYPGVLFVSQAESQADGTIFCNIKGDEQEETKIDTEIDIGDTDRCKDAPCKHNSTCVDLGDKHRCECKSGFSEDDCGTVRSYDCISVNPCTPANIAREHFYFKHRESGKFVQCNEFGQCFVMPCPGGLNWDIRAYTCNRP